MTTETETETPPQSQTANPDKTPTEQAPDPASTSSSETDPWGLQDGDDDLRTLIDAKGFKSGRDVLQSYKHATELLGVGKDNLLRVPAQSRAEDPEAWKAFDKFVGVPDAPDGYEIKLPDDYEVNQDALSHAKEGLHKAGLNSAQVQAVFDTLLENQKQFGGDMGGGVEAQAAEDALTQEIEAGTETLRKAWGGKFDAQAALAPDALAKLEGGEDLVKLLSDAGLDKHPAVLKAGANLAALYAEAGSPVTAKTQGVDSVASVQAKISSFEGNQTKMGQYMKGDPSAIKEYVGLQNDLAKAQAAGR